MNLQIIKTPGINGLGHTKKTRDSGNAIIAAYGKGKEHDIEEIHVNNEDLEEQEELIYENTIKALESRDKIIFLGGDHSISYSIGKGFLNTHTMEESKLIVFDAHPDLMQPMKNPTHEEWLRALIEYGWPTENILLIGLRKIESEEKAYLKENKIKNIEWKKDLDTKKLLEDINEFISGGKTYLSLDIDVINPKEAPGTHYKEDGGFTKEEMTNIISGINKENLRAIDIVEVEEQDKKTVDLAAEIMKEFL